METSPLSMEQLSKQAMNDASPKVPQMDPFEIKDESVRKHLSDSNPNKAAAPRKFTAMGS